MAGLGVFRLNAGYQSHKIGGDRPNMTIALNWDVK